MNNSKRPAFNYDPQKMQRESAKYYIPASDSDINSMLSSVGKSNLKELYSHIPSDNLFSSTPQVVEALSYEKLADHMFELSQKNNVRTNFIGDGLPVWKESDVTAEICGIRGLTTAYTPYQPERSQGTLQSLWIYQSTLAELTGFEAINASLYDRSTAIFEAMNTARRIHKNKKILLVSSAIYPQDIEVLKTHTKFTTTEIYWVDINSNGSTCLKSAEQLFNKNSSDIAGFVFPQTNSFGILEDVDALTDFCTSKQISSISIIDPMLLAEGGLKKPTAYGSNNQGCNIIIGEAQHLALTANFGGPGLGMFGIRYNEQDKNSIRSTAGRFVGKTKDIKGRDCKALILSTREQHIRREKATSNICSNQSFVATLAGANLLRLGGSGLKLAVEVAHKNTYQALNRILKLNGVKLKFDAPFFNEVTLVLNKNVNELIQKASARGLWIGANLTGRNGQKDQLLKISFSNAQSSDDIEALCKFFETEFTKNLNDFNLPSIPQKLLGNHKIEIKTYSKNEVIDYYKKLGSQNLSPDDGIYPLGSCTMKYNPYINDWAASLKGFTMIHPQAPVQDAQGCLEILYKTQEFFKKITGLAGVTTQPLAGAQGELVGLKLFQAYHEDKGEADKRKILLIPRSAHGTNPATATVAGFENETVNGIEYGIKTVEANEDGEINLEQIKKYCDDFGPMIAGVMVTNPNTAGIFESNFKKMAEMIHKVGGLVYMDGANMNAIAGWVNLAAIGVDAVHNNLHKTWTIPHGGGGPGDGIVAVSDKLIDFLPGHQIEKTSTGYVPVKTKKSIGEFHRHWGNFAHKIRAYTYIMALGSDGIQKMSAVATLSAQYLLQRLSKIAPTLPAKSKAVRMHEFILTLNNETFEKIQQSGTPKAMAIARIGKLFLDFGFHAPTVAFPEVYGLMIEPTESFTKKELDDFASVVEGIYTLINENPEVLQTVPHFTPIDRVDEVSANKTPVLFEKLNNLSEIINDRVNANELKNLNSKALFTKIVEAHKKN